MRTDEEAGGPLEVAMLARVLLEVCDTLKKSQVSWVKGGNRLAEDVFMAGGGITKCGFDT